MGGRPWSKDDMTYLSNKWGTISPFVIAKKLGRTKSSVKAKAYGMGLGTPVTCSEYIYLTDVCRAFQSKLLCHSTIRSRLVSLGIPAKTKPAFGKTFVISLKVFWKWAEQNKDKLPWRNLEEYALGAEPAWVKDERKKAFRQPEQGIKYRYWTNQEDKTLVNLANEGLSLKEIGLKMNRSANGISNRLCMLNIGVRQPDIAKRKERLTEERYDELRECVLAGMSIIEIAEKLDTGFHSVRYHLKKLYGTMNVYKAKKQIKEEQWRNEFANT